jgi:phospholipid/cholesterol/gamma-HCH transport system substrate-binding protein
MNARIRLLAAGAACLLAATGCGFKGAYSLPLPGGAAHGSTYHVTAIFKDVQDLTVQAAVRVDDVAVGDVTSIDLGENRNQPNTYLKAIVGMKINSSTHLPANAIATLEQTTLLGEKFVALSAPTKVAPEGTLANNAVIPFRNGETTELPSVQQVFGLLSQALNGSDLADLQTINVEVSKALAGREVAVRGALKQLGTFVGGLADQKHQIVRALNALNRFSGELANQDQTISTALTDLGPGLKVLADERQQFTALLTDLSSFGKVASHVINASRTQTITGLHDLEPILQHLSAAGGDLPRSLEVLFTYPFPRDSGQAAPGDYTNFVASLNVEPVLCAAFANIPTKQLITLLTGLTGEAAVLAQLGALKCPEVVGLHLHLPPLTGTKHSGSGGSSGAKGTGGGGTGSTGGGTGTTGGGTGSTGGGSSPTPTPSPTSSGLAGLLNGLIGGGRR